MAIGRVYVVMAAGLRNGNKEALRTAVCMHLKAIGGPIDVARVDVAVTGKGVVKVTFTADTPTVVDAKRVTKLYFAAFGVSTLDEEPRQPGSAVTDKSEAEGLRILQEPATDADALFVEALLATVAEHGAMRPQDIAERLRRTVADVERILERLVSAGYVVTDVESVVTLTAIGKAEASRGRKGIINLLLGLGQGGQLSTYDMAKSLGVTVTIPKRAVSALVEAGYLEVAGYEPRTEGQTARPRRLYRLTAFGWSEGAQYDPRAKRKAAAWTNPTAKRASIIWTLFEAPHPLTVTQLWRQAHVSRSAARALVAELHDPPFIQRHEHPDQVTRYSLTKEGRELATGLVRAGVLPPKIGAEVPEPETVAVPRLAAVAQQEAATTATVPRAQYRVTVSSPTAEVVAMLARLAELEGVTVEPVSGYSI